MSANLPLPGAPHQQSMLRMIAELYASDDRILAVLLFGSLGRDDWDKYSDLDVAVVVRDDAQIDVAGEMERVRTALAGYGERTLFTQVAGNDGYLVPESLCGIALDYHPLRSMSPYVLDGWRVLIGSLDEATIRKVAEANDRPQLSPSQQLHRALWLALSVDIALQRQQFWPALPGLERMRGALWDIFATSHGGKRALKVFEEEASVEMKAKFGRTFPEYFADSPAKSVRSLGEGLMALLHLIEHDLDELSNGEAHLGPGERELIVRLKARQAALLNSSS